MTTQRANVARRLKVLRTYLAKIDPDLFEMATFKEGSECGTHMCVGGHMANIPEFKRRGYHLQEWGAKTVETPDGFIQVPTFMPHMRDRINDEAIHEALGITHGEVKKLCFEWDNEDHHGKTALRKKLAQIDGLARRYGKVAKTSRKV